MSVISQTLAAGAILGSSLKWHVPPEILLGIYGQETAFGANVATSSAGAIGPLQFEPATAAKYGYPLTNNPTPAQVVQQFDAAGHYLSDLYAGSKSWASAVQSYSGGGYTLQQAEGAAFKGSGATIWRLIAGGIASLPTGTAAPPQAGGQNVGGIAGALDTGAQAVGSGVSSVAQFLSLLTKPSTWLRLLEGLGGVILLIMGLRQFAHVSGIQTGSGSVTAAAAKVAAS